MNAAGRTLRGKPAGPFPHAVRFSSSIIAEPARACYHAYLTICLEICQPPVAGEVFQGVTGMQEAGHPLKPFCNVRSYLPAGGSRHGLNDNSERPQKQLKQNMRLRKEKKAGILLSVGQAALRPGNRACDVVMSKRKV